MTSWHQRRKQVQALLRSMDEHPDKWRLNPYSPTSAMGTSRSYGDWIVWSGGIVMYVFGMCQIREPVRVNFTPREWLEVRKRMRRMREKHKRAIPPLPGDPAAQSQ